MFEKEFNKINLNNQLNEAVINQDLKKIKELFTAEQTPFLDHEINGVPLILYAAQHKNWDIVEEFYNMGANLDVKIEYINWYLLHECVKSAPLNVAKAVAEYADINVQTKDGKTPLMVALKEDKKEIAEHLLSIGTNDLSLIDKEHNNCAHYAAKHNQYDLLLKIIEAGAPLNKENRDGKTPLDLIEDISFKENLPKMLTTLKKIQEKENKTDKDFEQKLEQESEPIVTKKVSGLSSIKRN